MTPILTPSLGGFLSPTTSAYSSVSDSEGIKEVSASFIPVKKHELLNRVSGCGLKMEYRFTRSQHLMNPTMVNIELIFTNESSEAIKDIKIGNKVCMKNFADIDS